MNIKGMNSDMTCRGFQFEIGKEYKIDNNGKPLKLCSSTVFHYCKTMKDVHAHYPVDIGLYRYFEIEVLGEEITDGEKYGSNHIKIIREIEENEVKELSNIGEYNDGYLNCGNGNIGSRNIGKFNNGFSNTGYRNNGGCNLGDCNTGDCNTGDCNTGDYNLGDYNTGDYNLGDCNTGDCNTGDYNLGDRNTGSFNIGNRNTGHFNKSNNSYGMFCTQSCKEFKMFDKAVIEMPPKYYLSMLEKIKNTINCLRIGFYDMDSKLEYEKHVETILNLPNFDPKIFKNITSLDLTTEWKLRESKKE